MEERRQIVRQYVAKGLTVAIACQVAALKKGRYYYKSNGRLKGKTPSSTTMKRDGTLVSNEVVVARIIKILEEEFIDYGYQMTTAALRNEGFIINHKKVYRLMKERKLLHKKKNINSTIKKTYVEQWSPRAKEVFQLFEMDIKYVYIYKERRNAYLLSAIDVLSRFIPAWDIDFTMKNSQVIQLLEKLKTHPLVQRVIKERNVQITIRTDNGPQFVAIDLNSAVINFKWLQEFIQKATPQQNGHIESFHSTLNRLVTGQHEFETLEEARTVLNRFYNTYNEKRIMKATLGLSPVNFINKWLKNEIGITTIRNKIKFFFREEPVTRLSSSEGVLV